MVNIKVADIGLDEDVKDGARYEMNVGEWEDSPLICALFNENILMSLLIIHLTVNLASIYLL